MAQQRVLVVGDDYYASLAAVRALRSGGYEPWFAASTRETLARHSRTLGGSIVVPDPADGASAFVRSVAAAAGRIGADVVLPGTEAALMALAGRDADFAAVLGVPSPELVRRATDKAALAGLVAGTALQAPAGVVVAADGELPELAFPAIAKPVQSTIAQHGSTLDLPVARRLWSVADLHSFLASAPAADYLVQPYVEGSLGALAGVAWRGEIVGVSQQSARRIFPLHAGASAYAETVPVDPALSTAVAHLLASLEWSGVWELQFIATADARQAIDFNPRFYGSMELAIASGLNLPSIWVDLLLGRQPRVGRYRVGTRYRAEVRDVRALAAMRSSASLRGMLPHRRTAHAVFSRSDPLPAVALATRSLRRRWRQRSG